MTWFGFSGVMLAVAVLGVCYVPEALEGIAGVCWARAQAVRVARKAYDAHRRNGIQTSGEVSVDWQPR